MTINCKLYASSQWMKCVDMMLSHQLQLDVPCDVFNASNWLQLVFWLQITIAY
jgi:hypothetical protein